MEALLSDALRAFPVVVLTGARQTGKTTLVQRVEPPQVRACLTLDDLELLDTARRAPEALLKGADRITLDEVQKAPDLLLAIQRAVDRERVPGRFLLAGSANLLLRRVSESLAGRAVYLTLGPLTRGERRGRAACGPWSELLAAAPGEWQEVLLRGGRDPEDWRECCRRGGYPFPSLRLDGEGERERWNDGFVRTYLERDLGEVAAVSNPLDFHRLMKAFSLRIGGLLNQADLARDIQLSAPTVHRHLDLLEATCQIVRLPGFSPNQTRRLIKAPNVYWTDIGLALHVSGQGEPEGAHLENLVLGDLLVWRETPPRRPELSYWRTASGMEWTSWSNRAAASSRWR